jgi:hypothetical protein
MGVILVVIADAILGRILRLSQVFDVKLLGGAALSALR